MPRNRKPISTNTRAARIAAVVTLLLLMGAAARPAQAQEGAYALLHTFTNSPDGANPGPLIGDAQGNLYGTTRGGGPACVGSILTCGTVFKVNSAGNETVLYTFKGDGDGAYPIAGLIRDAAGNLYGNTEGNGAIGALSTVFKLDTHGNETVLHDFNGPEGCCQDSPLALDAKGNIYGTSPYSGDYNCDVIIGLGCGSIYQLTPAGKIKDIHIFTGTDGIKPEGGVVLDDQGNVYGTTLLGGNLECFSPAGGIQEAQGCGTVFKLDRSGALTVLHTFTGQADGSSPLGLIRDPGGNLYGIASYGGDLACYPPDGCGTIFEVDANGNFSVLATVTPTLTPEPLFASHLFRDPRGNLYGAAQIGGANFSGFIFKIGPSATLTNIFSFPSTAQEQDGNNPQSITMDSTGSFYGSMLTDGDQNNDCGFQGCGTVFKVTF
jgi:uncharacterized repeat protein (TIGR03803 family)